MLEIKIVSSESELKNTLIQLNPSIHYSESLSNLESQFRYLDFKNTSLSMVLNNSVKDIYFLAIQDKMIVGYLNISLNNFEFFGDWIAATEVLENFRQQGIATQLYKALFQWLSSNNFKYILGSSYTKLGENMFNMITKIANENNIYYIRPKDIEMVNTYEILKSKIYNAA